MSNDELLRLKAAALKASPGPWSGDRYDGTVKYELRDANGKTVIRGDNGNSGEGGYGIENEEDEEYFLAASPDVILALIAKVEATPASANGAEGLPELPVAIVQGAQLQKLRPLLWALRLADNGGDYDEEERAVVAWINDAMQEHAEDYARAILAASSPNKELLEALKDALNILVQLKKYGHEVDIEIRQAHAALRAAGVEVAS